MAMRGSASGEVWAAEEALTAAMHLFWRHGYEPTTHADLADAMVEGDLAALVANFGTKEQIYRSALALYLSTHGAVLRPLHDFDLPSAGALRTALLASAAMQTDRSLPTGCMVVLSATNTSAALAPVQAHAATERRRNRETIRRRVVDGIAAGGIPEKDVDGLATLIEAMFVGMSIMARDGVPLLSMQAAISCLTSGWSSNDRPPTSDDGPTK